MRTLCLILLICSINFSFGENPNNKNSFAKIESKLASLSDSLNHLRREVQVLKEKQEWKNQILEERLKQASDIFNCNNSYSVGWNCLTNFNLPIWD